ncbi:PPOX class probable F420-dependent enzyme [Prauserella shujinwangii]|uniref:PPOX class probable F420-dependent enzyme n=1 Tax=Prauserella shujinwangii TaxID=1453103 RepID=A0A2T0LTJ0_9PSEU|nr:PPOX class F420-dependent oxidoreductase [Prauserella shujinwangii]PRX46996.1 PPOX class probable F420-dependent enzyme [Prauserella shujinwangii]
MATTDTITTRAERGQPPFVVAATLLGALLMLPTGVWLLVDQASFATFVNFLPHVHFERDAGAFQVGIGVLLLLSLVWRDGPVLALTGFLVANTVHAVNHVMDLDLGGHASDPWVLLTVSVLAGVALWQRLRQLDDVVGEVAATTTTALAPLVRHKTALLTTYRRDGRPGSSPVSAAVDGDRAYLRSFEKSLKARRMRHTPQVELRPSTQQGRPTGPAICGQVRELHGKEYRHAARTLRRKHPFLHGLAVPLMHRLFRRKFGRTVHFEFTPTTDYLDAAAD